MTLHDLRCDIYRDTQPIRDSFPLTIGGLKLEINETYDIVGKLIITQVTKSTSINANLKAILSKITLILYYLYIKIISISENSI